MKKPGLLLIAVCILAQFSLALPAEPENLHYLVLLKEPSIVEQAAEWIPADQVELRRSYLESAGARSYAARLEQRQERLAQWLRQRRVAVLGRHSLLLNLLVITGPEEEIELLRRHEEVKGVYPDQEHVPLMDSAPAVVNAPAFWSALGGIQNAGRGVRIGIIDSGISQNPNPGDQFRHHPMFSGDGFAPPEGFPKGDVAFTNNKVIVARTYVLAQYGYREQENKTPADELGHGTQVAGVAAGGQVQAPLGTIQGIAPQAFLGNYKVFGQPGVNSTARSSAIIAALEDGIKDGMNVFNLSLGGSARNPATDPEQQAIANASAVGVVVVIAAGNSGPDTSTVSSPGTSPDAITAGASTNGRIFASTLEISSASSVPSELRVIAYVPAAGATIGSQVGPAPIVSIAAQDNTELACQALPAGSLSGKVALVQRGICTFASKANNVKAAGAMGMVVYNNVDGGAIIMSEIQDFSPAVMIDKSKGEALRNFLSSNQANVTIKPQTELAPTPSTADVVSGFSSRGPNITLDIKPDLTAPGQNIHTASRVTTPEPQYSTSVNGTSFATPVIAGAAALVKQLHPDWPAKAIKSALVNTARKSTTWNSSPARAIQTGNGRLDLEQALRANAMLDPVSVSFGILSQDDSSSSSHAIKITNLSSSSQTYQMELVEVFKNSTASLSLLPSTMALSPGQTGEFTVTAQFSSPLTSGSFEGYVRVRPANRSGSDLTASFWGAINIPDTSIVLRVSKAGSKYSSISSALEAARSGNIIEIADSSTYQDVLRIRQNSEGLSLDGVTLRSGPGQTPTIDARGLTGSSAAVTVIDRKNITIEGLRVRGGLGGINFFNSSGIIRNNVIEEAIDSSGSHGINLSASRAHVYGNTIQNNGRTGVNVSSSFALVQRNKISENKENGIFGSPSSSLALFDNEVSKNGSNNNGQGIRISETPALIKGNTILDTQGDTGDGILIRGGETPIRGPSLVVQDNSIERSRRSGISLFNRVGAAITRNRVRDNKDAGLYAEASTAGASAIFLANNGKGVELLESNFTLLDSLVAGSKNTSDAHGHGITAKGGSLKIFNSTISSNSRFGVNVSDAAATIFNSILYQNSQGELGGGSTPVLKNNLIGSGQAPAEGNISADPLFTDIAALDFSLKAGSPAIDRGSNETVPVQGSSLPLPREDLLFHQRPVDGNGDGVAQVDLGAIEFGSTFGAKPLILPVLSTRAGEFVGLAMANAFRERNDVLLRGYTRDGTLFGTFQQSIAPGSQLALLLAEAFPALQEGWIEILSTKPDLTSFTLLGNSGLTFMDGAELAGAVSQSLLFPELRNGPGEETNFYIVNPHDEEIEITLLWFRPSNRSTASRAHRIPKKGMLLATFSEMFDATLSAGESPGYVQVEAAKPVYGMEIFGNAQSKGGLLALDRNVKSGSYYGAQLASGSGVETTLTVINQSPNGSILDLTLDAFDERGELLKTVTVQSLPFNAAYRKTALEIFGFTEPVVGWLQIKATARILGSISFGNEAGRFLASLPLQNASDGAREFILSHVAQTAEVFTGVTLLNPNTRTAMVSLEVFDKAGNLTGTAFLEISAGQKVARLLNEFIPDFKPQSGGFIRVRSNVPIFSFELFGSNSLDFLSAVPQQLVVK